MIDIFIAGDPKTKGSSRAFVVNGRAIVTSNTRGLKHWEQTIRSALGSARIKRIEGPVQVELGFSLPRPKAKTPRPKSLDVLKRHPVPDTRPDIDKLTRGCLDALNRLAYADDGCVVSLELKRLPHTGVPSYKTAWCEPCQASEHRHPKGLCPTLASPRTQCRCPWGG